MKTTSYILASITISAFLSCAAPPAQEEQYQQPQITAPATVPEQNSNNILPDVQQPSPAIQQAGTQAKNAKPNPAHGAPGHRCDIPVGAPLDSPPADANNIQTPKIISQTTPVSVTPQPQKVGPGMNPEHGQAGHRCDISVGAPLNSAPVKPDTIKQ